MCRLSAEFSLDTYFLPSLFRKYIACIFQFYIHYCVCAKNFTYTERKKVEAGCFKSSAKQSSSSPYFSVFFMLHTFVQSLETEFLI